MTLVRATINKIGYVHSDMGFDGDKWRIKYLSADNRQILSLELIIKILKIKALNQGLMFGLLATEN